MYLSGADKRLRRGKFSEGVKTCVVLKKCVVKKCGVKKEVKLACIQSTFMYSINLVSRKFEKSH